MRHDDAPQTITMRHGRGLAIALGVTGCHDLHAWTITSGMPVLSVHVVTSPEADGPMVLDALGDCLKDHFDIEHSTFQLEPATHREHEPGMHA